MNANAVTFIARHAPSDDCLVSLAVERLLGEDTFERIGLRDDDHIGETITKFSPDSLPPHLMHIGKSVASNRLLWFACRKLNIPYHKLWVGRKSVQVSWRIFVSNVYNGIVIRASDWHRLMSHLFPAEVRLDLDSRRDEVYSNDQH